MTKCHYNETLFQLETATLSIQIHVLSPDGRGVYVPTLCQHISSRPRKVNTPVMSISMNDFLLECIFPEIPEKYC